MVVEKKTRSHEVTSEYQVTKGGCSTKLSRVVEVTEVAHFTREVRRKAFDAHDRSTLERQACALLNRFPGRVPKVCRNLLPHVTNSQNHDVTADGQHLRVHIRGASETTCYKSINTFYIVF